MLRAELETITGLLTGETPIGLSTNFSQVEMQKLVLPELEFYHINGVW